MSDFAAFLSNDRQRNVPWKGHADFPKRVIQYHAALMKKRPDLVAWYPKPRIFELDWQDGQPEYFLLSAERIQEYMDGSA